MQRSKGRLGGKKSAEWRGWQSEGGGKNAADKRSRRKRPAFGKGAGTPKVERKSHKGLALTRPENKAPSNKGGEATETRNASPTQTERTATKGVVRPAPRKKRQPGGSIAYLSEEIGTREKGKIRFEKIKRSSVM